MEFFRLRNADMPWGDYGDILLSGMASHLARVDGRVQLERTGPFVPPMIVAGLGELVVTDNLRQELEGSGLGSLVFKPVIKARIVDLDWTVWDMAADEPPVYPESGEPEDYILERPHSASIAASMGELWEVCLEGGIGRGSGGQLLAHTWTGQDLFLATNTLLMFCTEKAKRWLERRTQPWLAFERWIAK